MLKQNNKVITQYKQNIAENSKRIKLNLKELNNLKKFKVESIEKSVQISLHVLQIRVNLRELQRTDLHKGLSSDVIEKFSLFTAD